MEGIQPADFFSPDPRPVPKPHYGDHFKWMEDWGFDFIRLPIAYPYYLQFDRSRISAGGGLYIDEQKIAEIDQLVLSRISTICMSASTCTVLRILHQCGLYMSL